MATQTTQTIEKVFNCQVKGVEQVCDESNEVLIERPLIGSLILDGTLKQILEQANRYFQGMVDSKPRKPEQDYAGTHMGLVSEVVETSTGLRLYPSRAA